MAANDLDATVRWPFGRHGQFDPLVCHGNQGNLRRRHRDERVQEHRTVVIVVSQGEAV